MRGMWRCSFARERDVELAHSVSVITRPHVLTVWARIVQKMCTIYKHYMYVFPFWLQWQTRMEQQQFQVATAEDVNAAGQAQQVTVMQQPQVSCKGSFISCHYGEIIYFHWHSFRWCIDTLPHKIRFFFFYKSITKIAGAKVQTSACYS